MARPRRTRRISAVQDGDEGGRAARRTRRSPDTSAQQAHEPTKKQHQKHDTHTGVAGVVAGARPKVRRVVFRVGGVSPLCCRWAAGTRRVFGGQQGVCLLVARPRASAGGAVKWGVG